MKSGKEKRRFTEITIESYDKTAAEYAKNVANLFPKGMEKFFEHLKPGSYILDLGCGSGKDAKIFIDRGYHVIGIDLSKELLKIAKKTVPDAEFKLMDIVNLDFQPNTFDGIWAISSVVHIPKDYVSKTLQSCYNILKDEGIMYVSVKKGVGEEMIPDDRYGGLQKYWSFFQEEEIKGLLEPQGFKIIENLLDIKDDSYVTNPYIDIICRK